MQNIFARLSALITGSPAAAAVTVSPVEAVEAFLEQSA